MIWVEPVDTPMSISNNTISLSYGSGIYYVASSSADTTFTIDNNTINNNRYGIHVDGNPSANVVINVTGNTFSHNTYPAVQEDAFPNYTGNTFNADNYYLGIGIDGGYLASSGTWSVVQGEDMWMLEDCGRPDLGQESLAPQNRRQLGPQDLHRHPSPVLEILGQIHRRHATGADLALHLVTVGEGGSEAVYRIIHMPVPSLQQGI